MKRKKKRLYIVAIFEPMYNAPKVLSNEGNCRDITYRLWENCGYRKVAGKGFILNMVEITWGTVMSRLLIARQERLRYAKISALPKARVSHVETPVNSLFERKEGSET